MHNYLLLLGVKGFSRVFYRFDVGWVGDRLEDPWGDLRLIAILNHTSLYEPLFAGSVPNRLLADISRRGVVPVAEKTLRRPLVGRFFRLVAPQVVPVTRMRDHTWSEFARSITPQSLVVILPEGRMKRQSGLDAEGQPMTVRGGIADILRSMDQGRMLLAYSGGLHHVQAPGEVAPRLFRTLRIRFETLDVAAYREARLAEAGARGFKQAVVRDLEARRNRYCPVVQGQAG
ncbi:MAG TPA: 1-acyl-sn-glycerol-3-phosphate acyltransferase [Thermoanaerobaculia bacterium]|nr:1-acyl-sn-glycerol-3-phosphate acyltransferase [Thermoanaerobaculia bacterium]